MSGGPPPDRDTGLARGTAQPGICGVLPGELIIGTRQPVLVARFGKRKANVSSPSATLDVGGLLRIRHAMLAADLFPLGGGRPTGLRAEPRLVRRVASAWRSPSRRALVVPDGSAGARSPTSAPWSSSPAISSRSRWR